MSSGGAEAVRVVCRCRPARSELLRGHGQGSADGRTDDERATGKVRVKKPSSAPSKDKRASTGSLAAQQPHSLDGFGVRFHPDGQSISVLEQAASLGTTKETQRARPHLFTFDHVFDPNCTQSDVFDQLARDTVKDVLRGYNGSIFAYGQTGSGKTFTMFGPSQAAPELRGVIPRCAEELFAGLDGLEELEEVTIKCSFLEIYKEVIQDLLNPGNVHLRIREEKNGEVYVQGLSDEYVSSADDILQLLAIGERSRTVASTDMNEVSSRSHSVLIIVVTQKLRDGSTRIGKLNMADLAGSERIERTNATGVTLDEAKMINQSLSALGNCINALTDAKRTHIPFRDSTLTFLLKDSLGGNTKTTLLVCCSGEESDVPETLSTLNFAKRAKKIKNTVSVNTVMGVKELTALVDALKRELGIALRQIVALQKAMRLLKDGGEVDDAMMEQLMRPPALPKEAAIDGAVKAAQENGRLLLEADSSRPSSPTSTAANSAFITALNTPATTVPPTPALSPTHSSEVSVADSALRDVVSTEPSASDGVEAAGDGVADIAHIRQMISAARDEVQAINGDLHSSSSPPPHLPASSSSPAPSDPSSSPPSDAVRALQEQLERERAQYRKKAKQWHLENSQLRVEKEMLRVSARASDALISNLSNTVKAQKEREARRAAHAARLADSDSKEDAAASASHSDDDDRPPSPSLDGSSADALSTLLSKNERLEAQIAEMKATWGAYLDLILENQKSAAHRKEAKERERQEERDRRERDAMLFAEPSAYLPAHRTRIVVPVRVGEGGRFFSPPKVAVPVGASPLALATPMKEEDEGKDGKDSREPVFTPVAAASSTSAPVRKYSGSRAASSPATTTTTLGAVQAGTSTPASASSSGSPAQTPNSSITSSILSSLLDSATSSMGKPPSPFLPTDPSTPSSSSSSASSATSAAASSASALSVLSRSTLQDVLKRGYLYKKQMGWSMSMSANKAWRKRLFLLRHHCLDYYETSAAYPPRSLTPSSSPLPTADQPPAPSSTPPPPLALAPSPLLNTSLTGSLRGTIPLDPTTMVRVVEYGDVAWGWEIVTRDKEAKLHASSGEERDEWVEEVKRCVYRIRRAAGMRDDEIERLEAMQTQSDAITPNHPAGAVEL